MFSDVLGSPGKSLRASVNQKPTENKKSPMKTDKLAAAKDIKQDHLRSALDTHEYEAP